ncbi:nuclease A inhibitor family protein [Chitinophaga solisilvae]|uniref:Nuclease A inhibitor-like protein n=1 Tax=Chitinophaga solisilvae TaxID=1233460 RepID=A0A9Q5GMB0_9BACT|nr:nuclease A inhibitor family protein [Chitinophaga solisilvae]NSL88355.1 hypothetical protein [Chitinophaga solisilvae]
MLAQLTEKTKGVLYFSESEYPLTVEDWGVVPAGELTARIAALNSVSADLLKDVPEETFFRNIITAADPGDRVIVENAQRFQALQQWLKSNLADVRITRVETGTSIPVYITGHLEDGTCIALTTTAIES